MTNTKVIANIKTGYIKEIAESGSENISFSSYNAKTGIKSEYRTMSLENARKIENKYMHQI